MIAWNRIILRKLIIAQMTKNFYTFYGTPCLLSHVNAVHILIPCEINFNIVVSSGCMSHKLFSTKIAYAFLVFRMRATCLQE